MNILVAVDLAASEHSWLPERVVPLVSRIGGTVDVLYVRPTESTLAQIDQLDTRLRQMIAQVPGPSRGRPVLQASDTPEEAIVAATEAYDLTVVGPREPGALERWLKGTMATRVLLRARSPVLVPRGEQQWAEAPRILVGIDLSGPSQEDLARRSGSLAARIGGTVTFVNAVSERIPTIRDPAVAARAEREWLAGRQGLVDQLRALMALIPEETRGDCLLRRGDPEGVLVQLSREHDLLAMGNRGRTGLSGLLLGAVANDVVRRAHCDVVCMDTAD